jgi:four helix bundle protein
MKENILKVKSFHFAVRIVKLSQFLTTDKKEYILTKQILRSGTAIGALVRESEYGQSKKDFINKLSIALKEANETDYWLELLKEGKLIEDKIYQSLAADCTELIKLLIASIKTAKSKLT